MLIEVSRIHALSRPCQRVPLFTDNIPSHPQFPVDNFKVGFNAVHLAIAIHSGFSYVERTGGTHVPVWPQLASAYLLAPRRLNL